MATYAFQPIGFVRSCFKEKFGIPRQPGLVRQVRATIEMVSPYGQMEAFRRLEDFSHIWIIFVFHQSNQRGWKPTVRPPRLGGNQRVGVFASRSGFRPNAIGQSAVELISVQSSGGKTELLIGGADLLDGTPVLDIKPYLPYSDAICEAKAGYAPDQPEAKWPVSFSDQAARDCRKAEDESHPGLGKLITGLLAIDPRPGYRNKGKDHGYGMRLWNLNIKFRFVGERIIVEAIEKLQ